ncbi:MAG: hypothetical protein RL497_2281 [Pseudomonadota bacterium]|jgi:biopolymer transport protein ExbB
MINKFSSALVLQMALAFGGQLLLSSHSFAAEEAVPPAAPAAEAPVAGPQETPPAAAEAAPAPAADNAVDAAQEATKETAHEYGLAGLWEQGDAIAKGNLIIMVIMSAFTWYILATKLWQQQNLYGQYSASRKLWEAKSLPEGINTLKSDSAFRMIAEDGVASYKQHEARQGEKIHLGEWVHMSISRSISSVTSDLQNGMAFLATVGSVSPFVGLFGTVWGIYHALISIAASGQASIDKVAGPVGEALIMTAVGLAVAVPAVLGYNWLTRRNKLAVEQLNTFGSDVHAYLSMGVRGGQKD